MLRQSSPKMPILILYHTERESAEKLFKDFANRKQSRTLVVPLSDSGVSEEKKARKALQKGMNEVSHTTNF